MSRSPSPRELGLNRHPPASGDQGDLCIPPFQLQGGSPSRRVRSRDRGASRNVAMLVRWPWRLWGPRLARPRSRGPGTRAGTSAPPGGWAGCLRPRPGHLPRGQRGSAAGGGAAPGRGAPGPELGSGPAAAQSREGHGRRKSRRRQPSRERGERKRRPRRRQAALGPGSGRRTREPAARRARGWAEPLGRAERRRRRPRGPARPPEQAARGPPGPRPEPWARPRSSTTWTGRRRRTW